MSSSSAVQKAGTRTCKEAKARSQDYWPTRAFFCRRLPSSRQMLDNQGFEIPHNGVPRTFRDKRETAFEAARYAKGKARGDIIEIRECATGTKLVMLEDGRTG